MSAAPDFSHYTLAELIDAQENIDSVRFPDRVAEIARQIDEREKNGDIAKPVARSERWLRVEQKIKSFAFSQWLAKTFVGRFYRYLKYYRWGSRYQQGQVADRCDQWFAVKLDTFFYDLLFASVLITLSAALNLNFSEVSLKLLAALVTVYIASYLALNGYLLYTRAQTVGKYLVGIRIEMLDGSKAPFWRIFFVRTLSFNFLMGITLGFYLLINLFFILRKNKRSLHDYLAGTRLAYI